MVRGQECQWVVCGMLRAERIEGCRAWGEVSLCL